MNRTIFFFLFSFILFFNICAQIPAGYYDPAAGLSGQALQSALHNIIKGHTTVSYNSLYNYFETTDKKTNNTVWDMYSDIPGGTPPYVYNYNSGEECGNYNGEGDCYNREHSWPNSWFGGEVMPMYSDLFHLYPTDGYVNNRRSNYPYGEVGQAIWTSLNGSKLGTCSWPGYSGTVFEPVDAYKGDFARSYFYMSVRYYNEDGGWPGSPMTNGSQLVPWALDMMMHWSDQDPVSQKEINRNNAVYQVQDNRNPFIDHPEYADEIWGNGTGTYEGHTSSRLIPYPNPAEGTCYIILPDNGPVKSFKITLVDLTGKGENIHYEAKENKISLDVSDLSPGPYFISIRYNADAMNYYGFILKK